MDPREMTALLEERRHFADVTLDEYGTRRESYDDWHHRVEVLDSVYEGEMLVVWPDGKQDRTLLRVPNYPRLSRKHRVHMLAETPPTLIIRPEKPSTTAKQAAEKRERINLGYWDRSNVDLLIPYWGGDVLDAGLSVCKVMPDMTKSKAERFPVYSRIDPRMAYPSPIFTRGPFVDDCIIAYEMNAREAKARWPESWPEFEAVTKNRGPLMSKVKVMEFYDKTQAIVVMQAQYRNSSADQKAGFVVVEDFAHGLEKCPVVIGVAPSHDGAYRSTFDDSLAMLNTLNRIVAMHQDSAARKVYAPRVSFDDVQGMDDEGPDAHIIVTDKSLPVNQQVGFLDQGPAPYDNYNLMRQLDSALRTSTLLPPSVTGDPNESVTSAAGINATQSMPNAEVASLQRDSIAPMLVAANELAMRADEKHCEASKTITGVSKGAPFAETYSPSKDIAGNYKTEVTFGVGAGLDRSSLHVMLLQAQGAGIIADRTLREKSPFVDDPMREEQTLAGEQLDKAMWAAIIAGAAAPPGDPRALTPQQIAAIREELDKPDGSLHEAVKKHLNDQQVAAVTPPPSPSDQAGLASPGLAGAGEPQPPAFGGPPLEELLGA